jgi:serine/threonine-protein kinase
VPAPAPAPAPADNRPQVLFVDDDTRILNALAALFRQEYNVQIAEGGAAALEIMARGPIQVIVSDQRMPGLTGVEVLRKVRTSSPNTVRMLLTGYTDLASLVGSINEGEIFRFVMKPWDNDELKKALADAVKLAAGLAAKAPAQVAAPRSAGSLLVIDSTEGVARGLERLLAGAAHVILVATVAEAAKVLKKEEIAAVVADIGTGMDGLVALFRELKAKRPGVLSILLTDEPDAELAIELVNRTQIFRLLPKPVSARDLRTQVAEALRRYSVYKQTAATSPEDSALGDRPGALPDRTVARAT